jgi:8-oxo-dGTP pyrophosphatase MutT (NUDIX family)
MGKYDLNKYQNLKSLIDKITIQEVNYIYQCSHRTLYSNLFKHFDVKKNRRSSRHAHEKFKQLLRGVTNNKGQFIKFKNLVESLPAEERYLEPDWGFPKGRRNYKLNESDLQCAMRETLEETGIHPKSYQLDSQYLVSEIFQGTNHINYCHKYFLAKCSPQMPVWINPFNIYQASEIRKIGWYSYQQTTKMFRPYHQEKKRILDDVYQRIHG